MPVRGEEVFRCHSLISCTPFLKSMMGDRPAQEHPSHTHV